MILTVVGTILMLAGIGMVVYETAQSWTRPRDLSVKPDAKETKAKVPYSGVIMIGIGAIMVAIGTSGAPPPPTPR